MTDPTEVDWASVWSVMAKDPDESMGRIPLEGALTQSQAPVTDQANAAELRAEALDAGVLERDGGDYWIAGNKAVQDGGATVAETSMDDRNNDVQPATPDADRQRAPVKKLEQRITTLENRVDALSQQNRLLQTALFGAEDWLSQADMEVVTPVQHRVRDLEQTVSEHQNTIAVLHTESESRSKPDSRALRLRQLLVSDLTEASPVAVMTRDECNSGLGNGLNRATVLDAMRRAAYGKEGENVHGSSKLDPVPGMEFIKGTGKKEQSRICFDATDSDVTVSDLRNNVTTQMTEDGG